MQVAEYVYLYYTSVLLYRNRPEISLLMMMMDTWLLKAMGGWVGVVIGSLQERPCCGACGYDDDVMMH